jgi:N-acetylmuramoyl-L-alanine amidase
VRELHQRLATLGHRFTGGADTFSESTVAVVQAFQRSSGLPITGDVDATTWSRLVEAGWRLGQRLLYLVHPNLRGDDVAELQVRLAQLGFNPGRIDGIFGRLLESALMDFQRNCALEPSGALTRATLHELVRMTSYGPTRQLVTEARSIAGFDDDPSGPLVFCGHSPLASLLAQTSAETLDVTQLGAQSPAAVATYANENNACTVVAVESFNQIDGLHLHYWESYRSHSQHGQLVAMSISSALALLNDPIRVEVTGMALPLLRETRMTTLLIEHGILAEDVLEALALTICPVLDEVIHRPA